ncbi:MAG: hypothetical protein ACXWP5_12540 [Bdellovibrionota bacterium]
MERKEGTKAPNYFWIAGGVGALLALLLAVPLLPEVFRQFRFLFHAAGNKTGFIAEVSETYGAVYNQTLATLQEKVEALRKSEEENGRLRLQNAALGVQLEASQFECHTRNSAKATKDYELKLSKETGTRAGRVLASMSYHAPSRLLPSQLYVLAVSFMKAREDEKAAVILTQLTGMEDADTYKTSKNYMLTGISWYRLENFKLASEYFDLSLKLPETAESVAYQAQSRLWKALIAKKMKREGDVQHWLRELIDHHPHSMEAAWVNSKEADRATASEE